MPSACINIFGSCVTRDLVEFAAELDVGKYCARQSLVSSVGKRPAPETISSLHFVDGTHPFHERCVREDFDKLTLGDLRNRPADEIVVIDFIEERTPLGITECGAIFSLSQAATKFSNARSLVSRQVDAYSAEHIELFSKSIDDFGARLAGRPVIVHRALYAPGDWKFERENEVLERFYSMAIGRLNPVAVISAPEELRKSTLNHKWGPAPYHYMDDYYTHLLDQISIAMRIPVRPRTGFSLQKAPQQLGV